MTHPQYIGYKDVTDVWNLLGVDITHYNLPTFTSTGFNKHHLSFKGPLLEPILTRATLLTDNDTVFCGQLVKEFLEKWGVQLHFWCAYVLAGKP